MMARCARCRGQLPGRKATGRRLRFCSPACRYAAYRRRKRPQSVHFSSQTCEWATPQDFFDRLHAEFAFTLDACATAENAKCPAYFSPEHDGLAQRWAGRVWCNPPYGRSIGSWIRKARESVESGDAEFVVCLVPARVDTRWWHEQVHGRAEVTFLRGRLRFGAAKSGAPFPSALVVFRGAAAPLVRHETGVVRSA
jgi:phage N-6-adenine-methyltransferase